MKNTLKEIAQKIDGLLLELCEAGIYELDSETSPEGRVYNDVAKAANELNKIITGDDSGDAMSCETCSGTMRQLRCPSCYSFSQWEATA